MKKADFELFLNIQKTLEKIEAQNQGDILRIYARALREINEKVETIYKKYAKNGVLSNTDKTILNQMASIEKQAIAILGKKHSEVEQLINQRAALSYGESFFRHAYFVDKVGKLNLDWGVIPTNAVEFAFNNDYATLAKGQTFKKALHSSVDKVRTVFSDALTQGKSYQEAARNLVKVLGVEAVGMDAARYVGHGVTAWALMTSRTELHRAVVQGQQKTFETAKANGIDVKQVWCATLDERTRHSHAYLDNTYKDEEKGGWWVPEFEVFITGPNQSGIAAFDINCRCCVRPEVMGLKPEERYIRGEGITEYKDYATWKEEKAFAKMQKAMGDNAPKSLAEYKKSNPEEYRLFRHYEKFEWSKYISTFVDFDYYKEVDQLIQKELIGIKTINGVKIKERSLHFIDRLIGSEKDRRDGRKLENVVKALVSPSEDPIIRDNGSGIYIYKSTLVSVNIKEGRLIQTGPCEDKTKK